MLLEQSPLMIDTILGPLAVRRTGTGAPALLWHSLFVDSKTFDGVVEDLGAERELLLLDGPGHGRSPGVPRRYTLEDCADAAGQVLDALGISTPVDWVGNAWGGHVGIVFAHKYPARCRTLTTIGTPTYPLTRSERPRTALLVYLYRVLGPRPFSAALVEALVGPGAAQTAPAAAAAVGEAFSRGDRHGKYWAMQSVMLHRPDLRPLLPYLQVPVLMLAGSEDPMNDPGEAELAARAVPEGRFARVTGGGHVAPLLIAPGEVCQHVLAFWAGIRSRRSQDRPSAGTP